MYPYDLFLETDLYTVFLCMGILSAIIVFRVMADKLNIPAKLQSMTLLTGVGAIASGCFFAVLFQGLYNMKANGGRLIINQNTGATFYGGLMGGAAVFLLLYFVPGAFLFPQKQHLRRFYDVADIGVCGISLAHALGRVGCLMAGCCHGKRTDAWYGVQMLVDGEWQRVVPVQLFEAGFLLVLFGFFVVRVMRRKRYCLELYMCFYGIWRFLIEYLRSDERGSTVVAFLTPSQLIAVLMVIGGLLLVLLRKRLTEKNRAAGEEGTL